MDEMLILVCENEKGMSFSLLGGQTFGILHYIAFLKVSMQTIRILGIIQF